MGKTLGYGEITVANMTEPFTVMLTNEAQQFATDSNRKVTSAQSYYTDIIVIRGSQERTDYTIGNITSGSGITVSKNNKRVTFSVSAGATIGADTGVIEIPITLDGQTVKKQFSWSCGKQGIQGVKGTDGDSFAWNMLSHSSMIGEKIVCQYIEPCNSVITYQYTDEGYHIVTPSSGNANNGIVIRFDNYKDLGIDDGESISFSCDIKGSTSSKPCIAIRMGDNLWYGNDVVGKSATFTPTNNWQRFSVSTTTPSNLTKRHIWLAIHGNLQSDLYIKNLKLEKGISATPWSPSQSDIEGKGIAQIVQYYLATSQATGVTSSTSGWSTDITTQKLTADKKYLWNCSQTKYTDGTSEPITTPTIIGAYGDKGETGADGQDGAGFHWNLLKYSGDLSQMSYGKVGGYIDTQEFISDASTPSKNVLKSTITTVGNGIYIQGKYLKKEAIKKGNTYTVSAWCKCSSAKDIGVMNVEFLDKKVNISMPKLSTEWQQYIITGVANKDVTTTFSGSAISFYYGNKLAVGDIFYISSPKVEEGDKASPWCTTYEETLAKSITITPSAQIFKSTDGGNTFAPNQITITPTLQGDITFGKWQYSIDGGVSFADVVSGQSGLSVDTNKNLTIAKTSGLFTDKVTMVTFRAVASDRSFYDTCSIAKLYDVTDIEIGGVNLIKNSNFADGVHRWETIGITCTVETDSTYGHHIKFSSSVVGDGNHRLIASASDNFSHVKDTIYTLSFYAKASANTQVQSNVAGGANPCNYSLTTSWQRYTTTYKASAAGSLTFWAVEASKDIYLANIKLERGNKPTDYTVSPEDVQTAILSTKNSIENVSSKVDTNTKSIQDKVSKTTYETDLKLVKGDLSKANEGLNKWRYEIYPKSLFADKPEDQNKYDIGVFIRNKNLTPSRTLVFDDNKWTLLDYENNYIGYGLTFVRMSAKKTFSTKWAHSSSCSIYVNGKLIISDKGTVRLDSNNTGRDFSCTFIEGWNCIEFVMQETTGNEWFFFKDAISALSECQLMNCYYGTPVARQSHITNQLVENTTNIEGISGSVQKVMSTVGGSGKIDEFVSNYSTWKKKVDGIETRVGETYTTKSDFNGLEIGGRNLLLNSAFKNDRKSWTDWGAPATRELVTSNNKVWAHIVGNKQNYQGFNQWTESGSIKTGDNITFSARIKGGAANQIFTIGIHWMNSSNIIIDQTWHTFTVGTADDVYTWTTTASGANCSKLNLMVGVSDTSTAYNVYFTELKLEKGNKATDWTPAPEDDEINGQNLVSNLPANWEQGSFMDSKTNVGCDYATNKSSMTTRIRVKELVPVSGTITISNAYSNQSKKPIQHWITAFDVNKKWLGSSYVSTAWSDFPRIVDVKDAKYIAVIVRYKDESVITPSDISQICLKIERGTSATPFTLAPEDVNGKIVNVETIANQTANKFEWIVKGGDKSSSMVLTDDFLNIVANKINLKGKVTFESLSSDAKNEIGKVAQSKVDGLEIGGRNLLVQKNITQGYLTTDGKGSFINSGGGDQTSDWIDVSGNKYITITLYEDFTNTNNSGRYCEYDADKNCISTIDYNPRQKSSVIIELKSNTKYIRVTAIECKTRRYKIEAGNKATDWTPAPEDVSQDATNKASQALTDAKNYSSNAVNWVTNNGSSTTSLNSMVKKWTDGAVSDTTQINGGWIKANTITASKIAVGDFTNYCQLNKDTASSYGFTATDDTKGVWFTASPIDRDKDISQWFTCEGSQKLYVEYDLSTTVKGKVNASDTGTSYLTSGIMIFAANGTKEIISYTRSKGVTATSDGTVTHISLVETLPADARFFRVVLQTDGKRNTFSGTLKIRDPQVRKATTGKLIVDGSITANKIATDAIKSRNYISSGGTQGSFLNLSDGSFKSPNLSWDSNGNLIAKNANLSGEITAKDGTIGKYKITDQWLITGSGSTCTGIGGNQAFWAGAEDSNSAPFRVNYDGSMISTKGKIGDWKIDKMGLYNDFIVTFGVDQSDGTWLETFYTNYSAKTLYKANAFNNIFLGNKICCMDTHTEYTYLNDNSNKGDITYVESVILENGRINLHSSQYSDSRFALIPYDNYGSHLTLSGEAIEFSSYEADGTYSERNVDAKYTYTYISSDTIKTADVYCSNILRTNNLLVYEIISGRDIHLTSSANQIQLNASNQGSIELYGQTPFIDFHYNYSGDDYTSRIIANGSNLLSITGNLWVDADIHAGSWLYASEVHTSGAVVIASDSESFYWAHGYQIARGTSWGGVCVGDDSQQLRLYGSSIWAAHGISTSDENLKENFTTLDQYEDFYMNLNPIGFNYIGDYDGKKTHFGFGAHKTEDILESEGYDADKFAVVTHRPLVQEDIEKRFGKDVEVDIKTEYGVSYTEFIALNTHMIQKTRRELEQAKQEKADLETRLQAIEAKLGL
jgi:hypothetical protein